MRTRPTLRAAIAVATLLALSVVAPVAAPAAGAPSRPAAPPRAGVRVVVRYGDGTWDVRHVPAAGLAGALERLRARPGVIGAGVERPTYHVADWPDDPCLSSCVGTVQWAPAQVGARSAWDVTHGSPSVVVAVLDTGVDTTHPDLAGKVVVGANHSTSPTVSDKVGHGTHVAGTIGARTNNHTGVAGIGWDTTLLSIKVLGDGGAGFASDVAAGIRDAVAAGARVVNLSMAGDDDPLVRSAVADAIAAGVLVVAAAGNDVSEAPDFPAGYPGVIGVAATGRDDRVPPNLSRRGTWVPLGAPGVGIVSTVPGATYRVDNGTSMAAAHVSGAAALVFAAVPGIIAAGVRARLGRTAAATPDTGRAMAWGRLDVGAAAHPLPPDYWLVAADGGIFAYGAGFYGSTGATRLNQPIVGMAASPSAHGYWLVARDGGVFAYGDASFQGSAGGLRLNQPVVGGASTPLGLGYWLVASDGGIFNYGDAAFHGSTGNLRLNQPIVGIAPTPSGHGYWLVASDGGIFAFGDAGFFGSTGSLHLNQPIVGMRAAPAGDGYWLVARDGGIFAFGDAAFLGSAGGQRLNQPVVGMAG